MTADLDAVRAMLEGEPIAWRVRVKGDDPEEWVLLKAGGGADYLDRPGYECQPLYDSAARDLVPALAADLAATRAALAEAQGGVERLRGALTALEKQASITVNRGAVTGPHWTQLTIACLNARQALKGPAK